jgi:hypothetical protein
MAHEYQGGIEVFVVLLDVLRIVLGRFPLVHRVEVDAGIISLDRLKERPESILKATSSQRSDDARNRSRRRTTWNQFAEVGARCRSFCHFQRPP